MRGLQSFRPLCRWGNATEFTSEKCVDTTGFAEIRLTNDQRIGFSVEVNKTCGGWLLLFAHSQVAALCAGLESPNVKGLDRVTLRGVAQWR